jgi:hypothetical protein
MKITRAHLGHIYNITEQRITSYHVEVTRTPLHVELVDQFHTLAHRFTRPFPPLFRVVCWLLCQHTDAGIESWVWRKTQRWDFPLTDEQRDEFRRQLQ